LFAQENGPDCTIEIPPSVRDRQQYETSYDHVPAVENSALVYGECGAVYEREES
jgi:hypothetical protein